MSTIPTPPAGSELFDQLLPCKWRDVEFPVTHVRLSLAHDLVEHKYWGADSARVEATGLAPMRFSVTIPFINGIVPGKGESWGVLYPTTLRQFLTAFSDRKTGFFQHPEFGLIPCKPERVEFTLSADSRGGMMCEASFIETLEDDVTVNLVGESPAQEVELAALNLDAQQTDLKDIVPTLPEYKESFEDFARGIQAIGDQATLLSGRVTGKIASIAYRAQAIGDSIDRAKSALTWPATKAVEELKAATTDLRAKLLQAAGRNVALYQVPGDTTLAGLLAQLPDATLGDLIKLNPQLMTNAEIKKGTVVRYYVSRLAA